MQEFNYESLQRYFNTDYPGKDNFYSNILIPIFGEDKVNKKDYDLCQTDISIREQAAKANILSIARFAEVEGMGLTINVFDITLSDHCNIQNARKGIQNLVRQYVQHFDGALMLFHYQNPSNRSWRFSYMEKRTSNSDSTSAKRYTYLCGKKFSCKTLAERLLILKNSEKTANDFEIAFSVEALTKEFYKKLFCWYMWAIDDNTGVTFPNNTNTDQDDREDIQRKMIRLITRLLFVWFIKQKELVPNNLFDEKELATILRDFNPQSRTDSNYYNAILQNLFFATLNQEINDRRFLEEKDFQGRNTYWGDKMMYRDNKKQSWFVYPEKEKKEKIIHLFHSIPYLNGGLFECLDKFDIDPQTRKYVPIKYDDGFSSKDTLSANGNLKYRAFIPNILFFAPEHNESVDMGDGKRENIEVCGLIEIFRQYNFTTEENTITDAEVSLDPELLGKVFENLLAAYNPETKESVRKSTGSYYTPREIVDYMVDESLIAYLTSQCGHDANTIRTLFTYQQAPVPPNATQIADDLRSIKILDPACGSGAFPMGMLIRITHIIEHLEPNTFNRYETKLQLIKNCIYGIDIQPIAMLICKLRFFISLICDSEYRPGDEKNNYGITPLPNLETKFVAANSLLPAKLHEFDNDMQNDLFGNPTLKQMQQQLLDLRRGIFDLHTKKQKIVNRQQDQKLCHQISEYIKQTALQPDKQKITAWEQTIKECEELLHEYQGENIQKVAPQKRMFVKETIEYVDLNKKMRDELQSRIRNCHACIQEERNKSVPKGFMEAVEQVTLWNPYDQNQSSPFFDAKWMFGIDVDSDVPFHDPSKHGFDIVIGNPPYGAKLSENDKIILKRKYISSQTIKNVQNGSLDTFSLFIEFSYNLLRKNGYFAMIVPMSFISSDAMSGVHRLLFSNCNTIKISSYAVRPEPVFENAVVDTSIVLFEKTETKCNCIYSTRLNRKKGTKFNLKRLVENLQFIEVHNFLMYGRIPKIGTDIERSILKKVRACKAISTYKNPNGNPIFYRSAGGRYFKVVTNYTTNSSAEKCLMLDKDYADVIGCLLSSNLSFWYYQIYSDNHNWKSREIESFTVPKMDSATRQKIISLYNRYLKDIERNAKIRISSRISTYLVSEFKEYKIVKSKAIIDEIDDTIGTLYGLTNLEIEFIKNYEIDFRMAGDN